MSEKKPPSAPSELAKSALNQMSQDERKRIFALVKNALQERDIRKLKAGLTKLGIDENSTAYAQLMQLWDEHVRASRHR